MIPAADTWELYPALGVIVLVMASVSLAILRIWNEFTAWMDKQNAERSADRDKQRAWEAEQNAIRDASWQAFIREQSAATNATLIELSSVVKEMGGRISSVEIAINRHDAQVESRLPRTGPLGGVQ